VFVAFHAFGSPASRNGLRGGLRIVEVDGRPTPDLDAFVAAVEGRAHREAVRVRALNWNDQVEVLTLKLDNHYWPMYELVLRDGSWERRAL